MLTPPQHRQTSICPLLAALIVILSLGSPLAAQEIPVRDETSGALVWRPYASRINWSGPRDQNNMANGHGTLTVYDRKAEKIVATITGNFSQGRVKGKVRAFYPVSKDRISYEGGYLDWNESGFGTMNYRNGSSATGIWDKGQLIQIRGAGEEEGMDGEALQVAPEFDAQLKQASGQLQTTYDAFKAKLDPESARALTNCQRAWLKYHQSMISLATEHLAREQHLRQRLLEVELLLTRQRTQEIDAVSDWMFKGDTSALKSPAEIAAAERQFEKLMEALNQPGHLPPEKVGDFLQHFVQSWDIATLLELRPVSPAERQSIRNALTGLAISNLITATHSWYLKNPATPSAVAPAAAQPMPTAGKPLTTEPPLTEEKVKAILRKVGDVWFQASTPDAWPQSLPAALVQEIGSAANNHADPSLALAGAMDDLKKISGFLSRWEVDSSKALIEFTDDAPRLCAIDARFTPWIPALKKTAFERQDKANQLRIQATSRLKERQVNLALTALQEAYKQAPLPGDFPAASVLESYDALTRQRAISAPPDQSRSLEIPPNGLLDTATGAIQRYVNPPDPALGSAMEPYKEALAIAPLLKDFFIQNIDLGSKSPTPIKAYRALSATPEWKAIAADPRDEVKSLAAILESIKATLDPRIAEYDKVLNDAALLETQGKFAEAGEMFRKACKIESTGALVKKAEACEAKTSGL